MSDPATKKIRQQSEEIEMHDSGIYRFMQYRLICQPVARAQPLLTSLASVIRLHKSLSASSFRMSTADPNSSRKCANPGCTKAGKHLCSGCGEESYCSKECQKAHWTDHKLACKSAVKPEAVAFLKSFDSLSIKQLKNVMKAKAATYEGKKKTIILTKLESIVEKPNLVKFVEEHVQLSEVEALLSASANLPPSDPTSSSSSSKSKKSSSSGSAPSMHNQPMPTPKQLREQARMMREQPNAVRRANAMFQNMTDAQIRQYADQIEQAADDPAMMAEMARMAKMSPKDRNQLQLLQEGLSGTKPMDAAWIDATVTALKTNPKIFKDMVKGKGGMMGGMTDEQTASFVDSVSAMDAGTLKLILRVLVYLGSLYKPATELYATVDNYTFGSARYLVLFAVMILLYYLSVAIYFVLRLLFVYAIYPLYSAVYRAVMGDAAAAAAGVVKETVFQAASGVSNAASAGGLAAKVAAEGAAAAGLAGAGAAAAAGAASVAGALSGQVKDAVPASALESADDEF